ncbi:uncharacterized protein MKZ38_006795 [Zalerion maritima]|uniref:Methylated-DNA--protein-cysteine methyltransferase n=1 Tax=Zalerion maritima TaxID=339359 RepID=A0AAD5WVQ4_9PEZI|nr:uncharacterized protein MKZ38_006795 [Zalerion maritima]
MATASTTPSSRIPPKSAIATPDTHPQSQPQDPKTIILSSARGTPFEKRVWLLLLQIPAGSFSTYKHLATHLRSSPRAVGNALRKNPYAPRVPCHRVVATGGSLGGFKGKIARRDGEGITLKEKRTLLRKEGVKIGDDGSVRGTAFGGFV